MSRSPLRGIDVDAALEAAMHRFWRHGYAATSMSDLEAATGLPRQTLYNRFGSKKRLFLRVLAHYRGLFAETSLPHLAMAAPVGAAIVEMFETAAAEVTKDGARNGCLAVNAALEMAPHDREVATLVCAVFADVEDALRSALERGKAAGEFEPGLDAAGTAEALFALLVGLRVVVRADPETALLQGIVRQAAAHVARTAT